MTRKTAPRFSGIGGHHSHRSGTVEWLTPPRIIAALGPFDLDPCAPIEQPYPTARRTYTMLDDGLRQPWDGRVWLNPPYTDGVIGRWLGRLASHGRGTALIFARTETEAFFRHVWNEASALLFIEGRINFHHGEAFSIVKTRQTINAGDEAAANSGAPTVLCAYGANDADVLAACSIEGRFVPLRIPRSVLVSLFAASNEGEKINVTWRELLDEHVPDDRPISVDELYRAIAGHPKAAGKRHARAKVRQELQRGPYQPVQLGLWERAP